MRESRMSGSRRGEQVARCLACLLLYWLRLFFVFSVSPG